MNAKRKIFKLDKSKRKNQIKKDPCIDPTPKEIPVESLITAWQDEICLLYTSPSPRDKRQSRMPSSA